MAHYITQDNITLILRRLPVKTLLRFRSVCKEWKELIDSPLFIKEHMSLQNPSFFVQSSMGFHVLDPPSVITLQGPIYDYSNPFWGTHNGVLCVFDYDGNNLMLCNPSMYKFLRVSIPKCMYPGCEWINVDDSNFAFWIDPSTKEFKLFIFTPILDTDVMELLDVVAILYSSTLRDWRLIPPPSLQVVESRHPLMVQGVAHWIAYTSVLNGPVIILSFDFVLESINLIEMPARKKNCVGHPLLCHWQGNLSVVNKHPDGYSMCVRQGGVWTNMFWFELIPSVDHVWWVLGDKEWLSVLAESSDRLDLYDTRDRFSHSVENRSLLPRCGYEFVESLVFVQGKDLVADTM